MERERENQWKPMHSRVSRLKLGPSHWEMTHGLNLIKAHQVQHKQIAICMVTDRRIEVEDSGVGWYQKKKSRSPQVWRLMVRTFKKTTKTSQRLFGYPVSHSKTALDFNQRGASRTGTRGGLALLTHREVGIRWFPPGGENWENWLEPWLLNGISWCF